jgi:hypothetical protein
MRSDAPVATGGPLVRRVEAQLRAMRARDAVRHRPAGAPTVRSRLPAPVRRPPR